MGVYKKKISLPTNFGYVVDVDMFFLRTDGQGFTTELFELRLCVPFGIPNAYSKRFVIWLVIL